MSTLHLFCSEAQLSMCLLCLLTYVTGYMQVTQVVRVMLADRRTQHVKFTEHAVKPCLGNRAYIIACTTWCQSGSAICMACVHHAGQGHKPFTFVFDPHYSGQASQETDGGHATTSQG